MFCDVVSKNGNLLIGVGPRPDGTIPEMQQAPLRGLGALARASTVRPSTAAGPGWSPSRRRRRDAGALHVPRGARLRTRHGHAGPRRIALPAIDGSGRRVRLVGHDEPLEWSATTAC